MDGLLNFLSRKRSRGPAAPSGLGRAAGRGSDAFHDARVSDGPLNKQQSTTQRPSRRAFTMTWHRAEPSR